MREIESNRISINSMKIWVFLHLQLSFEAKLLLAKLHYCKGAYDETLRLYDEINLDNVLTQNMSPRVLQLLAESFSIKGNSEPHDRLIKLPKDNSN